jgi:hypothetical protein
MEERAGERRFVSLARPTHRRLRRLLDQLLRLRWHEAMILRFSPFMGTEPCAYPTVFANDRLTHSVIKKYSTYYAGLHTSFAAYALFCFQEDSSSFP